MALNKFLILFFVLLKITIVFSTKCENQSNLCLEMCCKIDETFAFNLKECQALPESAKPMWLAYIKNLTQTENITFIEYGECSSSPKQYVIDNCYSAYYDGDEDDYVFKEYVNIPCARYAHPNILGKAVFLLSPILLPILLAITCTKKDKKNKLSFKLITWYLTTMIASLLTLLFGLNIESMVISPDSFIYSATFAQFFGISSFLWLSCIGYNAYVQFKAANFQNTDRKDRIRFIRFSTFVWVGSLTMCSVAYLINRSALLTNALMHLTSFFNLLAFLVLAFKICSVRCRVIGISTEKHIICKLVRLICRLAILMGIPRMLLLSLKPLIGLDPFYVMLVLEPYLVYGTFILEFENCNTFFRCKCCCSSSGNDENDIPMVDIPQTSSTAATPTTPLTPATAV